MSPEPFEAMLVFVELPALSQRDRSQEALAGKAVEWQEKVSDEQYEA